MVTRRLALSFLLFLLCESSPSKKRHWDTCVSVCVFLRALGPRGAECALTRVDLVRVFRNPLGEKNMAALCGKSSGDSSIGRKFLWIFMTITLLFSGGRATAAFSQESG